MIELNGKITLVSGDEGELGEISTNNTKNNIASDIDEITGFPQIKKPFIMHEKTGGEFVYGSKFTDGHAYYGNVGYYVSKSVTNGQGVFATPITITVNSISASGLTIVFDDANNIYPTSLTVSHGGTQISYSLNSPQISIPIYVGENTISISGLNTPNSQLIIRRMYDEIVIDINGRSLHSCTISFSDVEYNDRPSYGLISNQHTLAYVDANGDVINYASSPLLEGNKRIELYIENTDYEEKEKVLDLYVNQWNYDEYQKLVTVNITDDLIELQDLSISGYPMEENKDMQYLYEKLYADTPQKYGFPVFQSLPASIKTKCTSIVARYFYLDASSLWEAWNKWCNIVGVKIYKKDN